ncbi:MAG: hypothetical protein KKG59_00535, partial [Nanoarchaeota archaeon]|nr:hypothetical protein [Nanoarchaeota archaeon]
PINSYAQPTDSLPFFLRSLRLGKAHDLVEVYKPFLENKVFEYKNAVFDRKTQLVKRNMYFSSIKDGFKRDSSCYDNCCVAALSNELNLLKLKNPFRNHDFKRIINQNFWNGKYYYDDLSKEDYVAADANIFPYYFGIINDKKKLASSIQAIQKEKLDDPMPIKYTNFRDPKKQILVQKLFTPNYEGTTVWIHLGLAYMCVVAKHDKVLLRKYLEEYKNQMILKYNNFLEVLNPDTTPYKSAVYFCDDSMSWASIYLNLKNHA